MPIFEYICKQCDHQFEALVYGEQKAECPKCHGAQAGAATLGICRQRQGLPQRRAFDRSLWFVRRPPRAGILLASQLNEQGPSSLPLSPCE